MGGTQTWKSIERMRGIYFGWHIQEGLKMDRQPAQDENGQKGEKKNENEDNYINIEWTEKPETINGLRPEP